MNARDLRRLADLLKEYGLSEIEVEREGERVRLRREPLAAPGGPGPYHGAASPSPAASPSVEAVEGHRLPIEAPMVGTFYRAASPDGAPYVREGDLVKKGQVVCIIEAMKLMNEIESKVGGRIAKVLVDNAQPVQYGQPLFLVEP